MMKYLINFLFFLGLSSTLLYGEAPAWLNKTPVPLMLEGEVAPDLKVILKWESPIKGAVFKIYRASSPIKTTNDLLPDKIIAMPEETVYTDKVPAPGEYYYAVTSVISNQEKKYLVEYQNYTVFPVKVIKIEKERKPVHVKLIDAHLLDEKRVEVVWQGVEGDIRYKIYRSTEVIDSPDKLDRASMLAVLSADEEKFIDETITKSGEYYYAVTVLDNAGEHKILVKDESYTSTPVKVMIKKPEKEKPPAQPIKKEKPLPQPETTKTQELVEEKTISTQALETISTQEVKPQPAVQTQKVSVSTQRAITTNIPVVTEEINEELEFKKIINNYYYTKDYNTCINELKIFIKIAKDEELKARAELFMAKSYYYLHKYKKALKLFIKLRKKFPEECDFWIERYRGE